MAGGIEIVIFNLKKFNKKLIRIVLKICVSYSSFCYYANDIFTFVAKIEQIKHAEGNEFVILKENVVVSRKIVHLKLSS